MSTSTLMPSSDIFGQASCARPGTDPNWFDPDHERYAPYLADALCKECPIRRECGDWAMREKEAAMVWAGSLPDERLPMRSRRSRVNPARLLAEVRPLVEQGWSTREISDRLHVSMDRVRDTVRYGAPSLRNLLLRNGYLARTIDTPEMRLHADA